MWSRSILKQNAKTALAGNKYWVAFAVCLVSALITGIVDIFTAKRIDPAKITSMEEAMGIAQQSSSTSLVTLLIAIFITLPLTVGMARFFLQNRFGKTEFSTLFSGFTMNYGGTLAGMFTTGLFIFLWTLLFIVPGIIKLLEYTMVPYILSDNPSMPGGRAREISRMMTKGEKGSIFVLYLSFLGWYILASAAAACFNWAPSPITVLAGLAATAAVSAYQNATVAELYIFMRDRIIQSGMASAAEFGLAQ